MTTGEAIKNARIKANMTQAALAEKLNVTPQNISQYERDIKNPKIETLQKIASALDIPITKLISTSIDMSLEEMATGDIKQLAGQLARTASLADNEAGRLILIDLNNLLDYICVVNKRISDANRVQILEDIDHVITDLTHILSGHALESGDKTWLTLAEEARDDIDTRIKRIYSLSKKLSQKNPITDMPEYQKKDEPGQK